jgi:hypothetical protein
MIGEREMQSSIIPSVNTAQALTSRAILYEVTIGKRIRKIEKETKKADPPARAVGVVWIFLSLGMSIAPIRFEIIREGAKSE